MSDKKFYDAILDDVLKQATSEVAENENTKEAPEATFSDLHNVKIECMIKDFEKKEKHTAFVAIARKVAIVLIAGIAVVGGLVMTVEAVKKKTNESWIQNHEEDYMSIHFDQSTEEKIEEEEINGNSYMDENIQILYLPEGFHIDKTKNNPTLLGYSFVNNGEKSFTLRIELKDELNYDIDTEEASIISAFSEKSTIYKIEKKEDTLKFIWTIEDYLFEFATNLSQEEALKIIENIRFLKK